MDTRLTSVAAPIPINTSRPDLGAPKAAVRTELSPPVAVAAQAGAEQSRFNRERRSDMGQGKRQFESTLDFDRETGDLIYRVIDPSSRATISQYPYEGLLKLRAYIKATTNKE
jgi:hypothetical protein